MTKFNSDYIQAAYRKVCRDASASDERFVSLYEESQYYGGPEEGGWYGTDMRLVETQRYASEATAYAVYTQIEEAAKSMTADSRAAWAQRCSAEMDWCEDRGLDADYLPEPDGPSEYRVVIEAVAGSRECRGPRHYE